MTDSLGIDLVINPELEAAKDIKQNIDFPEALNVENFLDGRLKLVEFHIDKDSILDNISFPLNSHLIVNFLSIFIVNNFNIIRFKIKDWFKIIYFYWQYLFWWN